MTPSKEREDFWQGSIPWVSPKDMKRAEIVDTIDHVSEKALQETGLKLHQAGGVLVVVRGMILAHTFPVARNTVPVTVNQDMKVLRPAHGVSSRYLAWMLEGLEPLMLSMTDESAHGTKALRTDHWENLSVPMPSSLQQERIANFLDEQTARIDSLIAEKEALAASLKDIEEVTAYDLVTRGARSNVARTTYREEWLREAPAHWGLQKLRQLATIGNGSTPKRDNEDYWSGGQIPWLNSGAVNSSRITEASDLVTEAARKGCHLPMVRAGSTVVALTGQGKTRGAASITEIETTINQHLAYISLFDNRMTDEYLWVLLTGMYSVLRYLSDGEGSTKGALTCEQLNQLRVLVPPMDEQGELVSAYLQRVSAIANLRGHTAEHIARLREYRSSLISAAVTGQLDISSHKGQAPA